jgi:hypothetical protein
MPGFTTTVVELITAERLRWLRKLALVFALALVTMVSPVKLGAQSTVPFILVKAGRLLDPRTGNVLTPAAVLIEGDTSAVHRIFDEPAHRSRGGWSTTVGPPG